jgi:hypothetical protein
MDFESTINLFGAVIVTLGGSSAIVFGLSSWIGKIWATKLMEKDKSKYIKEIETLKNELQTKMTKMEHFHKISEQTYQSLFNAKIATYNDLLYEKTEYYKIINEDETFEMMDYPPEVYYNFFVKIRKIIDENRLYISNELSDKYDKLYYKIAPYIRKLELDEYHAEANNVPSHDFQENTYHDMVSNTSDELSEVLKQIDVDVKQIKSKIEFI